VIRSWPRSHGAGLPDEQNGPWRLQGPF